MAELQRHARRRHRRARRRRPRSAGPSTARRGRGAFGILFAPVTLLIVLFLRAVPDHGADERGAVPAARRQRLHARPLRRGADEPAEPAHRVDHVHDRDDGDDRSMLLVAIPLAYFMVFKAGKWELFLLLALVLADELAPVVKVYAWQVILGRNGILNWLIPGPPVEWLLYSRFAVILTLATTYITYTTIPIYAAMKAIEPATFEAATDLGAGWWQQARKILIPLAAPGHLRRDDPRVHPDAHRLRHLRHRRRHRVVHDGPARPRPDPRAGNWGAGSALNFLLLAMSVLLSLGAYRLARLNRIEHERSEHARRRRPRGEILVEARHEALRRRHRRRTTSRSRSRAASSSRCSARAGAARPRRCA